MPDGYVLPPGTDVGMSSWIVNRRPLFGEEAEAFVPERWLRGEGEGEEEYRERMNAWKRADLVFGGGSRSCVGKYIALLETYKVLPSLLLRFEIELEDPEQEWRTTNRWTVRQENIKCVLRPRGGSR